jgi:Potato inhibitor I family
MNDGKQGLVHVEDHGAAARTESPLGAAAENSPLHSMMIYDGTVAEDDGIHKTTHRKKRSVLKHRVVMVALIVGAIVGILALMRLTIWSPNSGSSNKQQNNSMSSSKTSWPELVGEPGLQAQATILQENSDVTMAPLVGLDCMVTMDYRTDRVWIWVNNDDDQTVAQTPMIG